MFFMSEGRSRRSHGADQIPGACAPAAERCTAEVFEPEAHIDHESDSRILPIRPVRSRRVVGGQIPVWIIILYIYVLLGDRSDSRR